MAHTDHHVGCEFDENDTCIAWRGIPVRDTGTRMNSRPTTFSARMFRRADRHEAKALIVAGRFDDLRISSRPGDDRI